MSPPTIAVIDDSPTVRKVIEILFTRQGLRVLCFQDGVEALRAYNGASPPSCALPDLFLIDIGLPLYDGYEVIRRLRMNPSLQRLPIIVLTRRDTPIDRLKSRLAGACDHVSKPFQEKDLVALVNRRLQERVGEHASCHHIPSQC